MSRSYLAGRMQQVKKQLEANDEQMAKHLKISVTSYQALESGARIIPLADRQRLFKRLDGLLDKCGLK